jgi:hypothetical protein
LLNGRDKAIERKRQNISAAMIKMHYPYISGYQPLKNYQKKIDQAIIDFLNANQGFYSLFEEFANQKIVKLASSIDFKRWIVTPPKSNNLLRQEPIVYFAPSKPNYIEIEQKNTSIGREGEKLVFDYEKWRLIEAGERKLAKEVKWISRDQGDGAGYDILSKELSGEDRFIEVKSTTLGKDTPIFFTKRENDFSEIKNQSFHLYRVFELNRTPKMFTRTGSFGSFCSYEATQFKGMF